MQEFHKDYCSPKGPRWSVQDTICTAPYCVAESWDFAPVLIKARIIITESQCAKSKASKSMKLYTLKITLGPTSSYRANAFTSASPTRKVVHGFPCMVSGMSLMRCYVRELYTDKVTMGKGRGIVTVKKPIIRLLLHSLFVFVAKSSNGEG